MTLTLQCQTIRVGMKVYDNTGYDWKSCSYCKDRKTTYFVLA